MKMMKKAASIALASALVVSLAACGSSGGNNSGSEGSDTFMIGGIPISLRMIRVIPRNP